MRERYRDLEWRLARDILYWDERRELARLDRAAEDEADAERLRLRGDDDL
jgi:hypothetical protein